MRRIFIKLEKPNIFLFISLILIEFKIKNRNQNKKNWFSYLLFTYSWKFRKYNTSFVHRKHKTNIWLLFKLSRFSKKNFPSKILVWNHFPNSEVLNKAVIHVDLSIYSSFLNWLRYSCQRLSDCLASLRLFHYHALLIKKIGLHNLFWQFPSYWIRTRNIFSTEYIFVLFFRLGWVMYMLEEPCGLYSVLLEPLKELDEVFFLN